jgi:hypothetical protein
MLLVAAVDVEWSKNRRIRDGDIPFCYSVVWLALPQAGGATIADTDPFWYCGCYVNGTGETQELIARRGRRSPC